MAGIAAFLGLATYAASKAGVGLLTKSAAVEVAADGIRINSVHPGHLDTNMLAGSCAVAAEMITAMEGDVPMNDS